MNQAPTAGSSTGLFQWPVQQRLRNVYDQMGSFKQVVAGLQEYQTIFRATSSEGPRVGIVSGSMSVGLDRPFPRLQEDPTP